MIKSNSIDAAPYKATNFDDSAEHQRKKCEFPTEIRISYGEAIDNIQLVYPGGVTLALHGDPQRGGRKKSIRLEPDERIIGIQAKTGNYTGNRFLFGLTFTTTKSIKHFIINSPTSSITNLRDNTIVFNDGMALACIYGSVGKSNNDPTSVGYLSCIGAYLLPIKSVAKKLDQTIDAGKTFPTKEFNDFTDYQKHGCSYPSEIRISYGETIDYIQMVYPGNIELQKHGHIEGGGNRKTIPLAPNERIIEVKAWTGTYYGQKVIYSLLFKLETTREYVGVTCPSKYHTEIQEHILSIPYGFRLGCIFGKSIYSTGFLNLLGVYTVPIKHQSAKLYWYAQNVQESKHLSHTGVYSTGEYSYAFGCKGALPLKKNPEYYEMDCGEASIEFTQVIATGRVYTRRDNHEYVLYNKESGKKYGRDNCGIRYAWDGVCHQMVNRLLFSCDKAKTELDKNHVKGSIISYGAYGVYGKNWESWLDHCLSVYNGGTSNDMANFNAFQKPADSDALTSKILEIDGNPALTDEEKIAQRYALIFEQAGISLYTVETTDSGDGANDYKQNPQNPLADALHEYIENHTQLLHSESAKNTLLNGEEDIEEDIEELIEKIDLNLQDFLVKCFQLLGSEKFEQVFGIAYSPDIKFSNI